MCKAEGMGITFWNALGGGKFETAAEREEPGGRTYSTAHPITASDQEYEKVSAALERVAGKEENTPASAALRYDTL